MSELEVLTQRQKLHNAVEGRVVLKNILSGKKSRSRSSSSDTSVSLDDKKGTIRYTTSVQYVFDFFF